MSKTKPQFNRNYECGPLASIDWVAGGNFDGFVYTKSMMFQEDSKEVIIRTFVLNQDKYDGQRRDTEIIGQYEFTDKDTLTVTYNKVKMRGKILRNGTEYIVFTVSHPLLKGGSKEVYQLN